MCNSFKNWMLGRFEHDQLMNIAKYGADVAWSGWMNAGELRSLYDEHRDAIWAMLKEGADELNEKDVLSLVAEYINTAKNINTAHSFESLLVYHAADKVACDATRLKVFKCWINNEFHVHVTNLPARKRIFKFIFGGTKNG